MPFQFPFATVLRIRRLREEREEQMLRKIFYEIAQVQGSIREISAEIQRMSNVRFAEIDSAMEGRDLRLKAGAAAALFECKRALEAQMEKLEQLKDAQLQRYQMARQEREAIGAIREKRLSSYESAIAVAEQRTLDDNFNARRARS